MKLRMLQLLKKVLWMGLLAFGWQTACGYSLLGPSALYPGVPSPFGDVWEDNTIGFNPIPIYNGGAPPYLGFDTLQIGPKNIGEGYRRNTPVIYYGFDQNFAGFFGVNGEQAVDGAMAVLNNAFTNNPLGQYLTNGVDSCSSNLVEFPLQSQSQNYSATILGLLDLKSQTLAVMMEQLGLADAIRYVWVLHNRYQTSGAALPCPYGMIYLVTMRNFDIMASPLNQLQYSMYVNGELYTYSIAEDCALSIDDPPPDADAVEVPADPLVNTPPVASGGEVAAGSLATGFFYTGLTRDDMAGLRLLYSSANVNTETAAPNSTALNGGGLTITNNNDEYELTTSNLTTLILASQTNGPVALQALYPGLVISSVITNFNGTLTYTFANVVDYTLVTNSLVQYQIRTTTVAPALGAPAGTLTTNTTTKTTTFRTNIVSGDFFLIPTNLCGLTVRSVLASNVVAATNLLGTSATTNLTKTTITSTNLVIVSTNHTLLVAPCEFIGGSSGTNSTTGKYAGVEKIQFVRVPDQSIDPLTGNFVQPVTNTYTLTVVPPNSSQTTVQTFQRVLTRPDILFSAADLVPGPAAINTIVQVYSRTVTFNMNNVLPGLAGPGTIAPPSTIVYEKAGPIYQNRSLAFLNGPVGAYGRSFIWGSFDGSTNDPIVYPNGASIATLQSEALIQISPATLPDATNGVPYYYYTSVGTNVVTSAVTLSVAGGQPPYTWMLATNSLPLPTALSLSSGGVISGTPNESGTFDFTVQMNDSSARSVQMPYSITIH
ncbi:MAG: Ig domain-containing protein [Verrucomicrobiota bacterium]|jgi:hypothetical protein